jgi:hypothetical protein
MSGRKTPAAKTRMIAALGRVRKYGLPHARGPTVWAKMHTSRSAGSRMLQTPSHPYTPAPGGGRESPIIQWKGLS